MTDIRLYQFYHPKGKRLSDLRKFKTDEELVAQGWTEDPENVEEIVVAPTVGVTIDQAKEASPDALIGLVKSLGFNVLTDDQLQAEIIKSGSMGKADLSTATGAALLAEVDRRSGNSNIDLFSVLQEQFIADPESLNKEELVVFGKEGFGLKLTMNMKEATLIGHINEAIKSSQ
jgi:hypothetical protein